jgi:hypothetical protein
MPQAPNKLAEIQAIIDAHPEIKTKRDGPFAPNRGGITQLAAIQFGFPFGRKSKDRSATNLSDDALCYKVGDKHEIYDILVGATGAANWSYAGTFSEGQNGYFVLPGGDAPPPGPPGPDPGPNPTPSPPGAPAPPPTGGTGGGSGGKGHDHPRIPPGMHPSALAVGKIVRGEVESQIGSDVPAGTHTQTGEDTGDMLDQQVTDDIKEVIVAITIVATHFALIVSATNDKNKGMLDDMMAEIMPELE